jgi:hypothetical protein
MTPQVTNRREGGLTTCHGHSRKFCDLERARDCKSSSETACGGRECAGRGWWLRGLKESNKPPFRLEYTKTAPKTAPKTGGSCTY